MTLGDFICTVCNTRAYASQPLARGAVCFGCHISTVNLGFTFGKEDFHGPTIRERQRHTVETAAKAGITAVPASEYSF